MSAAPEQPVSPRVLDLFAGLTLPLPAETGAGAGAPPPAGFMVEPAPAVAPRTVPIRHVIKMTVGPEFVELLHEVRAELSHSHPVASLETLLGECMKIALAARRKRSRAQAERLRARAGAAAPRPGSRHVPAEVRRQVWERDQGRCSFVAGDGRRCDARHQLELHHEVPFARGGPATVSNLKVLCKQHNDLLAREDYGDEHMNQFTRRDSAGG